MMTISSDMILVLLSASFVPRSSENQQTVQCFGAGGAASARPKADRRRCPFDKIAKASVVFGDKSRQAYSVRNGRAGPL
jgi:hypothetical protein